MIVYDSTNRQVTLGEEVGHGGEAAVYRVQGQANLLAKIYVPPIHPHYEPKVAWMKDHPPEEPDYSAAVDEHDALAWPIDLLYDRKGRFAGYLMPRIRGGVTLLKAFNPRERAKNLPFDRKYLHRIGRNLAAAVASLHAKGYVVGDLHESNVIVTPEALVTMIDTDSFQVHTAVNDEAVCYRCVVGKPEYTAPELQGKHLADVTREPEQDNFALAVLLFQLLMGGNHPFRSRWKRAGEPPPLEVKIARGLFPHVKPPPDAVELPPNVPSLDTLHPTLSALMQRCFVDGHKDPYLRPTAAEWRGGLEEAEAALVQCAKGHYHSNLLVKCPQCEAGRRTAKRAKQVAAARRRRAAAARQQQTTFPPRIQQRRWGTTQPTPTRPAPRPTQPRSTRTQVSSTRTPTASQNLRQRLGVVVLFIIVMCIMAIAVDALPRCTMPARGIPTARPVTHTPVPTWALEPTAPTLSPPLSGPPLPQSMVAISPENAEQIIQLNSWDRGSDARNVAFSPDGTLLASRVDISVQVSEVTTGRSVRIFLVDDNGSGLAFSPDGTLIAFGDIGTVEVWEVSTKRKVHSLTGHTRVRSVAFSPDGTLLVSGGAYRDDSMRIWSVSTGVEVSILFGNTSAVSSAVFSPDGLLLALGTRDGTVELWDASAGSLLRTFEHDDYVTDVAFSPGGTLLAAGSISGTAKVWEVWSGREMHTLEHKSSVNAVAFSPDGLLLATASEDKTLKLWEVSSGREMHTLEHEYSVKSVAFSPDGTLLASGLRFGEVTLWGISPTVASPSPIPITPDATSGVIGGIVVEAGTGLPIAGASVTTDPPTAAVTTDAEGTFAIPNVSPGSYIVTAAKSGYTTASEQVDVEAGNTSLVIINMLFVPQSSATPTLEVTGVMPPTLMLAPTSGGSP